MCSRIQSKPLPYSTQAPRVITNGKRKANGCKFLAEKCEDQGKEAEGKVVFQYTSEVFVLLLDPLSSASLNSDVHTFDPVDYFLFCIGFSKSSIVPDRGFVVPCLATILSTLCLAPTHRIQVEGKGGSEQVRRRSTW